MMVPRRYLEKQARFSMTVTPTGVTREVSELLVGNFV
jgi:hypothetical protein